MLDSMTFLLGAACLSALTGCASSPAPGAAATPATTLSAAAMPTATASTASAQPYLLQVGDEVDVRYGDQPQFDQTLRVRPDGFVSLPYIGTVRAAGLSADDLQARLRARHEELGQTPGPRRYLVQPGDELDLRFVSATNLNDLVRVRPDGRLQLQLVGTVDAAGLTPEQLQEQLRRRYANYLRRPDVAVIVRSTATPTVHIGDRPIRAGTEQLRPVVIVRQSTPAQIFVGGEVGRPGVLTYRPGLTLVQAGIEAGGRLPTADLSRVTIVRRRGEQAEVLERDLSAIVRGGDVVALSRPDLVLQPSDVIVFPQTRIAGISEMLNEYVFKNIPMIRNSSFGFTYLLGQSNSSSNAAVSSHQ